MCDVNLFIRSYPFMLNIAIKIANNDYLNASIINNFNNIIRACSLHLNNAFRTHIHLIMLHGTFP